MPPAPKRADTCRHPRSVHERSKPKRKPLPDHLPRQEVVHQPADDGACTCPDVRQGMAKLGEDVTEVLDYVPGHFQVIRHVRPKYACTACDAITQAPAPAMPTPRGRATPATLAHLLVSKYCDHLPLYRQSEIYAREGLELDRSTLCDWVGQAAWLLDPVVAAIRQHVFAAEKIHGDDTTVPVLAPGLGRTKTGRLWVYVRDDRPFCGAGTSGCRLLLQPRSWWRASDGSHGEVHRLAPGRRLRRVRGVVRSGRGPSPARSRKSHAGRIAAGSSSTSGRPRNRRSPRRRSIGSPRSMQSRTRPQFAPAAERVEHRRETAPLLDTFFDWAKATVGKLSAKSALAKAFRYTINRREALSRFVTDGRLEVDNNIAENAMRGHRARAEELSLLRFGCRRRSGSIHLHPRADGKAQRREPGSLPQGYPDKDRRRASDQPDRRADALADDPGCREAYDS